MEKRGKEGLKKIEETKIKLWAQSKKAQRQYYKNKIQSTLHKSMPHKWIFIQVDFLGQTHPLPIARNRGQRLTRFLHKWILDCPAPHKENNGFFYPKSTFLFTPADFLTTRCGQCVLSALGFVHTLYTRPYTSLTSYNNSFNVALERSLSPDVMIVSSM